MADDSGKRWAWSIAGRPTAAELATATARYVARFGRFPTPVSYTHLTLPTSDLV